MSDDGSGHSIVIPSFLLREDTAEAFKKFYAEQSSIFLRVSIEFAAKQNTSEVDLWFSTPFDLSLEQLANLRITLPRFDTDLQLHLKIRSKPCLTCPEEEAKKEAPILKEAQEMLKKWEAKDRKISSLWKKMNGWVYDGFNVSYKTMGVEFDKLYYESDTYLLGKKVVEEGLKTGHYYRKEDQSVWVNLSDRKLDDKLLLRADGTSVYMTQDIGTAIQRYQDFPGLSGLIYTVGNEQEHHFKVLFAILEKLGYDWAQECSHLSYGMVDLPTGKMKSREGTVVDADDLMQSVVEDARKMTQERGHLD